MNYHDVIKIPEENRSNAAWLSIGSDQSEYSRSHNAHKASRRFVRTARILPKGSLIGLRMQHDREGRCLVNAFIGAGATAAPEDFEWIFDGCAVTEAVPQDSVFGLTDEGGSVYTLRYKPQEAGSGENTNSNESENYGYDDDRSAAIYSDGFSLMDRLGGTVDIIASSKYEGKGWIIISLPTEMPLRMHTMLSCLFERTTATKIEPDSDLDDIEPLPAEILRQGIAGLLEALMLRQTSEKDENGTICKEPRSEEETSETDVTGSTLIEDLGLSVRAYNSLKRAGIRTVEQLGRLTDDDLCHIRNLGRKCVEEIRRRLSEVKSDEAPAPVSGVSCSSMLTDLIGLENVKEQVRKIAAFAKMQMHLSAQGKDRLPVVMNMEFKGNPGTAKTTVARIIAGIFHEIGLLTGSELIEVGRADLVARYEGQTADKVRSVFRQAKGKVLFIDEAYSLVENGEDMYGDEAINTIVQEMENNREDTVVIFAGYPDKMTGFFARNPGLRSRVPFTVSFSDYSADEMVQIAESEAKKRGFVIGEEARERVSSICRTVARHPEMGNGRFCRNLIEAAIMEYAARVYGTESAMESDFTLHAQDFSAPESLREDRNSRPIGFAI